MLLEALRNRDPGLLEKVRTRQGQWVIAGDEDEGMMGLDEGGEGKEWKGWEEVLHGLGRSGLRRGLYAYGLAGSEPGVA
jgi:hypothetical protein